MASKLSGKFATASDIDSKITTNNSTLSGTFATKAALSDATNLSKNTDLASAINSTIC